MKPECRYLKLSEQDVYTEHRNGGVTKCALKPKWSLERIVSERINWSEVSKAIQSSENNREFKKQAMK